MQRTENLRLYTVGDSEQFQYDKLINDNMETIDEACRVTITESGTSGDWSWEKRSDGWAVCSMRIAISGVQTNIASGAIWRSSDFTYQLPFAYSEIECIDSKPESESNTLWTSQRPSAVDKLTVFYMSADNATHSGWLNAHVEGWLA